MIGLCNDFPKSSYYQTISSMKVEDKIKSYARKVELKAFEDLIIYCKEKGYDSVHFTFDGAWSHVRDAGECAGTLIAGFELKQ